MELNEQTLEQILTRQEEKFERALTRQGDRFDRSLSTLKEEFDHSLKGQREQFQHYMGVQVEGLRSEIQLVAEAVSGIQEQLIALRDMVTKNTEAIEWIRMDMEIMKADMAIIRRDLKEKAGRDELAVLEARVAMLERSGRARS